MLLCRSLALLESMPCNAMQRACSSCWLTVCVRLLWCLPVLLLLLQLVNEKPQIIQDYESGKAIPNPQVLSKMSRVLGVTLRKNPK